MIDKFFVTIKEEEQPYVSLKKQFSPISSSNLLTNKAAEINKIANAAAAPSIASNDTFGCLFTYKKRTKDKKINKKDADALNVRVENAFGDLFKEKIGIVKSAMTRMHVDPGIQLPKYNKKFVVKEHMNPFIEEGDGACAIHNRKNIETVNKLH